MAAEGPVAGPAGPAGPASPGGGGEQRRGLLGGEAGAACTQPVRLTAHPCPQLEKSQFSSLTEPLPSPVDSILECLVLPSGELVQELADPIFYLLDALAGEGTPGWSRCGQGGGLSHLGLPEPL